MHDSAGLLELLRAVAAGSLSPAAAAERLAAPTPAAAFATIDHDREARCGFPEVVFGQGKTPSETAAISAEVYARAGRLLVTRASPEAFAAVAGVVPGANYHGRARTIRAAARPVPGRGKVAVVAAGTADLPVAEEAAETAEALGAAVDRVYDVGVAGLHRVLAAVPRLRAANAVVVCAGMEGALPSVVGGLVAVPVFATPTSVGYGAHFGGLAALLGMLNSCAANVATVNIDNGFGAGYQAALVNRLALGAGKAP
jgi:NCAIR mutase (PurE)-related protein